MTSDWWTCPSEGCDGDTRIIETRDIPTTRECLECDWSVTIPRTEDGGLSEAGGGDE